MDRDAFVKRLQQILDEYHLTAAAFADKVQAGRATISHILLGRNKPSLEFILKLTKAFPEVDLYWLLEGKEKSKPQSTLAQHEYLDSAVAATSLLSENKKIVHQSSDISEQIQTSDKTIKRILLLYDDGSFETYI